VRQGPAQARQADTPPSASGRLADGQGTFRRPKYVLRTFPYQSNSLPRLTLIFLMDRSVGRVVLAAPPPHRIVISTFSDRRFFVWAIYGGVGRKRYSPDRSVSIVAGHRALKNVGKRGQSIRRDSRRGGAFVCDTVPCVARPRAVFPALVFVRRAPQPRTRRRFPLRVVPPCVAPLPLVADANGNQKEINKASDARWTTTRAGGGGNARDHDARVGIMRGGDARRTTTSTQGTASHMNAHPRPIGQPIDLSECPYPTFPGSRTSLLVSIRFDGGCFQWS